jgi:hypothetical protein
MLKEIQHFIDHPDDIPDIPPASSQYLQVRLNPAYLIRTGVMEDFRKAGYSEQWILGFLECCTSVCEVIELMEESQRQPEEQEE